MNTLLFPSFTIVKSNLANTVEAYERFAQYQVEQGVISKVLKIGAFNTLTDGLSEYEKVRDSRGTLILSNNDQYTFATSHAYGLVALVNWCEFLVADVFVKEDKDNLMYHFELSQKGKLIRKVELSYNNVEKWDFYEVGAPLPCEDKDQLKSRLKKNKFSLDSIRKIVEANGMAFPVEDNELWKNAKSVVFQAEKPDIVYVP